MNDSSGSFTPDELAQSPAAVTFQVLVVTKHSGPLVKRVSLVDGKLKSDGSACRMSCGTARQVTVTLQEFGALLVNLEHNQAIALGSLRDGLPDQVRLETKQSERTTRFPEGSSRPLDLICRSEDYIAYRPGLPAAVLIDVDTKGMPPAVRERIRAAGGVWPALMSVVPEIELVGRVTRRSTTTGISRTDTGEQLAGSEGSHIFLLVQDGGDTKRFLCALHDRCSLWGLGWLMVGAAGQFLKRSLVDKMVCAGERLVFEAPALVDPPLFQDQTSRAPMVVDGPALDTKVCRDLSLVDKAKLRDLEEAERRRLAPEAAKAKATFIELHAKRIVERTGIKEAVARAMVERQCHGTLLPSILLSFDDLENITVNDVLTNSDRFVGMTLADPLEGLDYGPSKAMVMRRSDGSVWINSFAHGRATYELKHDAASIERAIMAAAEGDAVDVLVRMLPHAVVDQMDEDRLKALACKRSEAKPRALTSRIKDARTETNKQHADEARRKHEAERTDPRLRLEVPALHAPWLPVMEALNDVLGSVDEPEPPMRDIDGTVTTVRLRQVPSMHVLTAAGANAEEGKDSHLPPIEMPLLGRLNEAGLAELIEAHIDYFNPRDGRPVHLPKPFVEHFLTRTDNVLPVVAGIATLPIVLPDGTLLAKRGLDRERSIVFRVPAELLAMLPAPEQCDDDAVIKAFRFLVDEFLVDVATDFTGKCVAIAAALTLIERALLPDRPVFFVTAGRRGGGKTTLLIMLLMAITGVRPSAAAWSTNEEERRKALLAYLMEGVPAIVWDNIKRGSQITCPHIERSCTSAFIQDRKLGVSEQVCASAATVHMFTGNNVGPSGDLASRALKILLEILRHDPENRTFKHPDPIAWTEANRGKILVALYTLLLGNPTLKSGSNGASAPRTRFKTWYRLVGSTVERAARLAGEELDFQSLFLSQEGEDEETASLYDAMAALQVKWPGVREIESARQFTAADVAKMINEQDQFVHKEIKDAGIVLREFLFSELTDKAAQAIVSSKSVGKRLKKHCGDPVRTVINGVNQSVTLKDKPKDEWNPNAATTFWIRIS